MKHNWARKVMGQIVKGTKIMRCILKCSIAALVVLLTLATPLRSQVVAGSGEVSGNVGFSNLTGVDNNKHAAFGGAGAYNFTDRGTLGVEYSYQMMGSLTIAGVTGSAHIQSYGPVVRAYLTRFGPIVPYMVVAGGGMAGTVVVSVQGVSISATQNGYYFGYGVGASIYADRNWGIRPEFRYERQKFMSTTASGTTIASSADNYYLGTFSVFYQFGGK